MYIYTHNVQQDEPKIREPKIVTFCFILFAVIIVCPLLCIIYYILGAATSLAL
jgi:hypothetical protein